MSKLPRQPTLLINALDDRDLFEGIIAECDALGWRVANLAFSADFSTFCGLPIGAIFAMKPQDSTIPRLRKMGVPIIDVRSVLDGPVTCDACVSEDRHAGGVLAAGVLVERGFHDLGYVTFDNVPASDPLFEGYRKQAEKRGATIHICQLRDLPDTAKQRYKMQVQAIARWVTKQPKPIALFAYNHRIAIKIIAACELAGFSVPEQVAIVCRGNTDHLCRTAPVPLSAIDTNRRELGRQAVRAVKRLVDGEKLSKHPIYVPIKGFVERRSTDIVAVSDPVVAKAVRFIWDHVAHPLLVDDVARTVGVSRNSLERAFLRTLHRGVYAELFRKRMELCKQLLRGTTMTLAQITTLCGMNSNRNLHRAFKSEFGMTPGQYRKS